MSPPTACSGKGVDLSSSMLECLTGNECLGETSAIIEGVLAIAAVTS